MTSALHFWLIKNLMPLVLEFCLFLYLYIFIWGKKMCSIDVQSSRLTLKTALWPWRVLGVAESRKGAVPICLIESFTYREKRISFYKIELLLPRLITNVLKVLSITKKSLMLLWWTVFFPRCLMIDRSLYYSFFLAELAWWPLYPPKIRPAL